MRAVAWQNPRPHAWAEVPTAGAEDAQAAVEAAAGDILLVECTDPLTTIDIPNLIRETGDVIESTVKKGRVLTFRIRKS